MSKVQKQSIVSNMIFSDWDISPWNKETYEKHEKDFQNILIEYTNLKKNNENNSITARWKWLESKGAIKLVMGTNQTVSPHAIVDKFQHFSNMFDRFSDWLSFKERRELSIEEQQKRRDEIKSGVKKIDFSIPKSIMEGMERDISNDEMTQNALSNF